MEKVFFIGLGGFLGANARYWLSTWLAEVGGQTLPWGTFVVNVSGSALLAYFVAWSTARAALSPEMRLLVSAGFFGAYTTFSTFANETVALWQAGNWQGALGNMLGNNLVALAGVLLGLALAERI